MLSFLGILSCKESVLIGSVEPASSQEPLMSKMIWNKTTCVFFTVVTGITFLLYITHKISVTSFLCAQKQAKKPNQRNLTKGRLCPWCWLNMQLTIRSTTVSSAISIWTLILLYRLVSRSKGKLHHEVFCGLSKCTALVSGLMLSPSLRWNCLILPFSGEILSYRPWSINRVCCVPHEQFFSFAASDKGWMLWLVVSSLSIIQPAQRVRSISWERTHLARVSPVMGDRKACFFLPVHVTVHASQQ